MKSSLKLMTKLGAAVMSASIMFSVIPQITGNEVVNAAVSKNQSNTILGTNLIAKPSKPANKDSAWAGSYIYFGKYNNTPIKFRVLDPNSSVYTTSTMLLDSDACLLKRTADTSSNAWNNTVLKSYLNNTFISCFGSIEQSAIYSGTVSGGSSYASGTYLNYAYGSTTSYSSNKIFVLDAADVVNENYGYSSDVGVSKGADAAWADGYTTTAVANRVKKYGNDAAEWWLRCSSKEGTGFKGIVASDGHLSGKKYNISTVGVAPALHLKKSNVILSTAISGTAGKTGAEYKLTLKDTNIKIETQSDKRSTIESNLKVTIPYYVSGANRENVNRVSVLILDKSYTEGNTNNAKILLYEQLGGNYSKKGTGTFTLPSDLKPSAWNSGYYVYLIAEDLNGDKECDFCGAPYNVSKPDYKNFWLQNSNDSWSYYNAYGMKVTGWNQIDGNYYYFNNQGILLKDWRKIDGNWYFLGGNGILRTEWQQIGSNWYYFGGNGILRTGWQQIAGNWYYFGDSGVMRIGWQQIGGSWYYFDSKGHLLKGWQLMGGEFYYLGDSGVMRVGWQQLSGKWYYFNSKGQMQKGWQQIGSGWYYFGDSGVMRTGWQQIGGSWYYFNTSGQMLKSWQQINGKWYYFGDSGVMRVGWQKLGSYWYYFESNGAMVTGSKKIGNKTYNFDSNGRCKNP